MQNHTVWVRAQNGPLGERRYNLVHRAVDAREARVVEAALRQAGHQTIIQKDNQQPPHSGKEL